MGWCCSFYRVLGLHVSTACSSLFLLARCLYVCHEHQLHAKRNRRTRADALIATPYVRVRVCMGVRSCACVRAVLGPLQVLFLAVPRTISSTSKYTTWRITSKDVRVSRTLPTLCRVLLRCKYAQALLAWNNAAWHRKQISHTHTSTCTRSRTRTRIHTHAHAHTHTLAGYFTCSTTFSFKIHISTFGPELNFECTARRKKIKPKEEQPTFAWNALTSYNQNHT